MKGASPFSPHSDYPTVRASKLGPAFSPLLSRLALHSSLAKRGWGRKEDIHSPCRT